MSGRYLHRWHSGRIEYALATLSNGPGVLLTSRGPSRSRYALELLDDDAAAAWLAVSDDDRTVLAEIRLEAR